MKDWTIVGEGFTKEMIDELEKEMDKRYIFVFANEKTLDSAIDLLKKERSNDKMALDNMRFSTDPFLANGKFIIVTKEHKLFEAILKIYKEKEERGETWITI